jgi:hypothetical protein
MREIRLLHERLPCKGGGLTGMQMSRSSFFFARTVDVVYTNIVGNALPMLAFMRGICLGVARLWSGEGYPMV